MKQLSLLLLAWLAMFSAQAQFHLDTVHFAYRGTSIIDVSIADSTTLWALTERYPANKAPVHEIAKSLDGVNWTPVLLPDSCILSSVCGISSSTAWAATCQWDTMKTTYGGKLWKTSNGGASWQVQNVGSYHNGFLDFVYFFDANNGVTVGDPNGGYFEIYTTTDGGANWSRVAQADIPAPLVNETGLQNIFTTLGNEIWFSTTPQGRIFHSSDMGLTWSVLPNALSAFQGDFSNFENPDTGLRGFTGNRPIITHDGGLTLNTLSPVRAGTYGLTTFSTYRNGSQGGVVVVDTNVAFSATAGTVRSEYLYSTDASMEIWTPFARIDTLGFDSLATGFSYSRYYSRQQGWMSYYYAWDSVPADFDIVVRYDARSVATGIHDVGDNAFALSIYPNPAYDRLYVKATGDVPEIYTIYNITGQKLDGGKLRSVVDISALDTGVYFIEFTTQGKQVRKKFVKM